MEEVAKNILSQHKLRKTPFRIQVLDVFLKNGEQALSNARLESKLDDFDRITLYRTLKTFEKSGIIHQAIDGSNENKYALCHANCTEHNHHDNHAHFLCDQCGETYCIENVISPGFKLPLNYSLKTVHIALGGTCSRCR
ncbi:MAG: transcriptional repressor [Saprospiraceae bacterium]|nr:transcriptional repressor [Bacteroidia bacterium]MBT8228738.1 transcriptional repressor [Bacteroidia bacterium]NNF22272.1 transcriptional repressor [Saprospiraceae bacterium]NNK90120.1 transcriptional repressor [Saprospiraceae bacterium]